MAMIRRIASTPDIFGMARSVKITSGVARGPRPKPATPSSASPAASNPSVQMVLADFLGPKAEVPAVDHGLGLADVEVALVAAPVFSGMVFSPEIKPM